LQPDPLHTDFHVPFDVSHVADTVPQFSHSPLGFVAGSHSQTLEYSQSLPHVCFPWPSGPHAFVVPGSHDPPPVHSVCHVPVFVLQLVVGTPQAPQDIAAASPVHSHSVFH
jgi:hypothetical protein